jgi:hypothetical protein
MELMFQCAALFDPSEMATVNYNSPGTFGQPLQCRKKVISEFIDFDRHRNICTKWIACGRSILVSFWSSSAGKH